MFPADGASVDFTPLGSHELLIQATVQFCNVPILKKLKTKPAKQALKAHDCQPKVKKSKTKKDKFRGKVLKQKIPPRHHGRSGHGRPDRDREET